MSLTADYRDDTDLFEGIRTTDYADRTDAVLGAFVSNACVDGWHKHRHTKSRYPLGEQRAFHDGGHPAYEGLRQDEQNLQNTFCFILSGLLRPLR
jgi:hypothetical protein